MHRIVRHLPEPVQHMALEDGYSDHATRLLRQRLMTTHPSNRAGLINTTPTMVISRAMTEGSHRFKYPPPYPFCYLLDYCIPESLKSLHPIGNPISQSTQFGFNCPPIPSVALVVDTLSLAIAVAKSSPPLP